MSIAGINSSSSSYQVYGVQDIYDTLTADLAQDGSSTKSSKDSSSLSQMGQMMNQLFKLSTTDQDAFKELAQQISEEYSAKAESASTIEQSRMYSSMSAQFAEAASTGSMESLKPQGPPPPPPQSDDSSMSAISSAISSALSNAGISTESTASSGQDTFAMLMEQLESLQESDPDTFKEVTAQIASSLTEQAESATNPGAAHMLSGMAANFETAASTGDTDSLAPQGPPPPPPPPAQDMASSQSGSLSSDSTRQNEQLYSLLQSILAGSYSTSTSNDSLFSYLTSTTGYSSSTA
ncbi:hypothetical protein NNJEOMEG_00896 [Fundidesulfovibrio magnetotacticus]|uniref:Uncharacterized protein n=1 Tax=Fundidesulfovibrio magnetotacticus TaxID=2730080 RepID=A0A6V8LTU9_9BACT|nr:hypothetical protein [Fundidesulfovibrio magnetotacticus]GFK93067.1 hypothetical protein NNJEOMEG_00896 [Fundidesulfovibrio magnetotacticus]